MATLYAKAAGGNWSAAGTWSATGSGGADSAGPPTASDNVIFELGSGNVTIDATSACRSLDCTSGTGNYGGTLTHNAFVLSIGDATAGAGNVALKFSAGMTYTAVGALTISFISTSTTQQIVDFVAKNLGASTDVTFNGAGASWQFSSGVTCRNLTLSAGTLDTNGQTCSWNTFAHSLSTTAVLTLGASAITLTSSSNSAFLVNATLLTVSANTSTWTLSAGGFNVSNALNMNGASFTLNGSAITLAGTASFILANLTVNGPATLTGSVALGGSGIYVSGTLTLAGNSVTNRLIVQSNTVGTMRYLAYGTTLTTSNVDFADILMFKNSAYTAGGNIMRVADSSFETLSIGSWSFNSNNSTSNIALTGAVSTEVTPWQGTYCMKLTTSGSVSLQGMWEYVMGKAQGLVDAQSDTAYTFSAYVQAAAGTPLRVAVCDFCNNGTVYTGTGTATGLGTWDRLSVSFTSGHNPSPTLGNAIMLGVSTNAAVAATFYVDGMMFEQNSSASTWVVGGTATTPVDLSAITGKSGDAGGNGGMTFTPAATQTATGTASFTWSTHGWTTRVPLPQDNVVVNNAFVAGRSVTMDMPRLGKSLDFSGATGSPTLSLTGAPILYGSLTLGAGVGTAFGTGINLQLQGRGTYTITMAGHAMAGTATTTIAAPGGNYTLQDDFDMGINRNLVIAVGTTFSANNHNVKATTITFQGQTAITMGAGIWTVNSTGTVWTAATTMVSLNSGTSTISLTGQGIVDKTFAGGGWSYNILRYAQDTPQALSFTGANTFNKIIVSGQGQKTLIFPVSQVTTVNQSITTIGPGSTNPAIIVPTSIAGCKLWLKADQYSGSNGDPVSTWQDQSGNGFDVTQSGTARPTYTTNVMNGMASMRFDGVNDDMVMPAGLVAAMAGNDVPCVVFVVARATNTASNKDIIGLGGVSNIYLFAITNGTQFGQTRAGDDGVTRTDRYTPLDTDPHIFTSYWAADSGFSRKDGAQVTNPVAMVNNTATFTSGRIGARNNDSEFFVGDIFEVLIYNQALTIPNLSSIEYYLANRWGLDSQRTHIYSTVSGTPATIALGTSGTWVSSYNSIQDITVTGTRTPVLAYHGTNVSGNTGFDFTTKRPSATPHSSASTRSLSAPRTLSSTRTGAS